MTDWLATVLAGILIAVGIAGVIVPILPGLLLIWGAALFYGLIVGFGFAGWLAMAVITALALIGTGIGYYLPARKTRAVGFPLWGQLLVVGATVVGFFVVPVIGAILGLVLGTLLVALAVERNLGEAWGTGWAMLIEMLKSAAIQLGMALFMAMAWGLWALSVLSS